MRELGATDRKTGAAGFADDATVDALARLALHLVDMVGPIARRHFRTPVAVDDKPDRSPVTVADRTMEADMRRALATRRPDDGIIGEEYGTERPEADFVWVIDPIDGTKAFITGRPTFVTLVALLHQGRPVLGVIDQPVTGDRWLGIAGRSTLANSRRAHTRACPSLDRAMLAATAPEMFDETRRAGFDRLSAETRLTTWGGDGGLYGLLALGLLDVIAEASMALYDFAALVPVVTGAGGRIVDWQGRPLEAASDGTVLAVGDPALLDPALARLAG